MTENKMDQADAGAGASSEKVIEADERRPYVYTAHEIRSRLTGIRTTVAFVLKNTELEDYDDEMANDLRLAVKFLEQLTVGAELNISNDAERDGVSLNQSLHHTQSKEG